MWYRRLALVSPLVLLLAAPLGAQAPPCRPCAGFSTSDPAAVAARVAELGAFTERAPLYVAWDVALSSSPESAGTSGEGVEAAGGALRKAQVTPWIRLVFTTPPPLAANGLALEQELERAAALARGAAPDTHFQILWRPAGASAMDPVEYAYLIKRAAAAVNGPRPEARVISAPLPATQEFLETFYGQDVGAYLDGVALARAMDDTLTRAVALLAELDPGRPVIFDEVPFPEPAEQVLVEAARATALGASLVLFRSPDAGEGAAPNRLAPSLAPVLAPFLILAREFAGDLSYDGMAAPKGAEAWVFVRGSDLGQRVITRVPAEGVWLTFPDPQLKDAERLDLTATGLGKSAFLDQAQAVSGGYAVPVAGGAGPVAVLRLARGLATDLTAVSENLAVESERDLPVEEILRRLQAFEDDQARRLDHYQALNTTHLRFGAGAGIQSVEATLEGDFFYRQGQGFDWAWQRFFINGVQWRGEKIPEIPLIQPEKAAVMPIAITFSKSYDYRLAGSEEVDERDCWVIEFRPSAAAQEAKLYRGRVWVDRKIFARVRTKAVQLGLEGEVLSNEETLFYSPVQASGAPGPWSAESYFLPLRLVGQQLISVVNATTLVEREVKLTAIEINGADFDARRKATESSAATMVRDTDQGLRYLVKQEGSEERVVQEGFDTSRLFLLGGVFYDDALDYPLPLAGVNYLDFNFRGTGNQLNAFFGGALLTVNYADPRFRGSKVDVGADVFAFAIGLGDQLYRNEEEVVEEEVEVRPANVSLNIGRPVGNFLKLGLEYEVSYFDFQRADDTARTFVLPEDHLLHTVEASARFARGGYRLDVSGTFGRRSSWERWGLPGNNEFDPEQRDFLQWRAGAAKSWYLKNFQKIGAEIDYVGGEDLDRFSKYQFGFFGDTRVHGFQSGKVRAEEAWATHLSYGFEIGKAFRLEAIGDLAWATDEISGLDHEFLAGLGVAGTFLGPWETIINIDVGVPVAGPDDGFVAYIVFLKLFDR